MKSKPTPLEARSTPLARTPKLMLQPRSVRLTIGENDAVDTFAVKIGSSASHIVRMCVRYTMPKLKRGSLQLQDIGEGESIS